MPTNTSNPGRTRRWKQLRCAPFFTLIVRQRLRMRICCSILFLSIAALLFGCASSHHQGAPVSSSFTYNGINYSYAKAVYDVYSRAWELGINVTLTASITRAKVTIAKDGEVMTAKIFKSSGDEQMDKSVQRTLDSVRFVQPFESDTKDRARTFIITFDLRTHKRAQT